MNSQSPISRPGDSRWLIAASLAAWLAGCAGLPPDRPDSTVAAPGADKRSSVVATGAVGTAEGAAAPAVGKTGQPVSGTATATLRPPSSPLSPRPAPGGGSLAGQARSFSTRLATYTAVNFEGVPGWDQDNFSETWPAFLDSCKILTGRGTEWKNICEDARQVNASSTPAIRGFFERRFAAYQIRDDDRQVDGVVTGYFEPEIAGNRHYRAPFIYPVYGQPEDMLFLDARKVPAARRGTTIAARVQGRNVVIQDGLSTHDMSAPGLFALDLSALTLDTLDKKVRLRAEGRRLMPYYTRQEIETLGAPNARVLAFVSSATALYEMQIQGSGRIRLPDGEVVRVSYAEQNGQPFRPTLAQSSSGRVASRVRVRGSAIELELDDGEDEDEADDDFQAIRTRGFRLALPAVSGAVLVPGRRAAGPVLGSGIQDPSYVFFKESVAPAAAGPVGAFGVPLSAGRSIAVDPRSTPLGYPVFVSTRLPDSGAPMRRLTIAQDTGGAIRGAVRADYFFGNGQQAAAQARRMKERGQLWILLPRGLAVAAATSGAIRTRGAAAGPDLPQCLVQEEGLCVDD